MMMGLASAIIFSIYVLCMFDFPLRRGRNLFKRFEGLIGMIYYLYGLFFFGISVVTGFMLSYQIVYYFAILEYSIGLIVAIPVFIFFFAITLSSVERRSFNEMFLLRLQDQYPLLNVVEYRHRDR